MEIKVNAKDSKKVVVGRHGRVAESGRIFVPKDWIGKPALVCLLEEEK